MVDAFTDINSTIQQELFDVNYKAEPATGEQVKGDGRFVVSCVLPVSGRGSTGRAAVCSILLMLQCSLAPNSAETTDLQTYRGT